jgi:hypothetical protein
MIASIGTKQPVSMQLYQNALLCAIFAEQIKPKDNEEQKEKEEPKE